MVKIYVIYIYQFDTIWNIKSQYLNLNHIPYYLLYSVQCTIKEILRFDLSILCLMLACSFCHCHCTLYSVQCTVYSVQYTVYVVHCTVYDGNNMRSSNRELINQNVKTLLYDNVLFKTHSYNTRCRWISTSIFLQAHINQLMILFIFSLRSFCSTNTYIGLQLFI